MNSNYVRHPAYGTVQTGDPSTLNPDLTFTGQKADGTGLLYLNARYYNPTLGQFLSPDTLVPDAGVLFDYNRFMYTRGNPLKYTDPTGHLSEDEIRALLGNDYEPLMELWHKYDSYWISVLDALKPGGTLQASLLGDIELHFEGSGASIRARSYNGNYSNALQDWQAQGVYTVRNPGMNDDQSDILRDLLFSANTGSLPNTIIQPVFQYARTYEGKIDPIYRGARMVTASVDFQYANAPTEIFKWLGMSSDSASFSGGMTYASISVWATWIGTEAVGYGSVGGMLLADLAASVVVSYNAPARYATGWPGAIDVNPFIDLGRLGR